MWQHRLGCFLPSFSMVRRITIVSDSDSDSNDGVASTSLVTHLSSANVHQIALPPLVTAPPVQTLVGNNFPPSPPSVSDDVDDDDHASNASEDDNETLEQRMLDLLYEQNETSLQTHVPNVLRELPLDTEVSTEQIATTLKAHMSSVSTIHLQCLLVMFTYRNSLPQGVLFLESKTKYIKKACSVPGFSFRPSIPLRNPIKGKELAIQILHLAKEAKNEVDACLKKTDKKKLISDLTAIIDKHRKEKRMGKCSIWNLFELEISVRKSEDTTDWYLLPTWDKGKAHMKKVYMMKKALCRRNIASKKVLETFITTYM